MKRRPLSILFAGLLCLFGAAEAPADTQRPVFPDPTRFETAVAQFDSADRVSRPPTGAIVATGSSSMRGWHRRIAADLAPLTVIPRGFGGSNFYDLLHYADRLVLAYEPRAVLIYEGDNDVAHGLGPAQIHATFQALVTRLHGRQAELRIYVIGIKPSLARLDMWPQMSQANELLAAECNTDPRLQFIDVAPAMLGKDGQPRPEIFRSDGLHLNDIGYDAWSGAIGPILRAGEQEYEAAADLVPAQ